MQTAPAARKGRDMAGKVVHLDEGAHVSLRVLAQHWGVSMKECVERLVTEGVAENIHRLPANIVPVPKRRQPGPPEEKGIDMGGPPFWKDRDKL